MLKKVIIFLLVLMLLILSLFLFFKNGIKLDNLSLANINITQLYLKLDKKLIFTANSIEILPSEDKEEKPTEFDPSVLLWVDDILGMIGLVRIDDLSVADQHIFIELKENKLLLKHKLAEVRLDIDIKEDKNLFLNLSAKSLQYGSLLDAKVDAKIDTLSTKLYKPVINLNAKASHKDIKVDLKANLKNAILKYNVESNEIKNLEFINDFTKLDPSIEKLLSGLDFTAIKIKNLSGSQNIEKISDFSLNSLDATVIIDNLDFKYTNYPKITQKNININLSKGELNVNLTPKRETKTVSIDGKVNTTLDAKAVNVNTSIYYKDIEIYTKVDLKDEVLNYNVSSNKFKDIKDFQTFVEIPGAIKTWAFDRLSSKSAKINNVSGKVYLNPLNVDMSTLRVDAEVYDIVMDFNPKRAYPLNADIVYLTYDGKDMNMKLKNPRSNDVDLTGSYAVIYDMLGSNNGLLLDLQTVSPLNWTLVRAVQAYDVSIPNDLGLRQTKGTSDIKTIIDIPFTDNPVDVFVKIDNTNSTLNIKDNPIDFKTFHFIFKDNKVVVQDTLAKYQNYNANIKDMLFDIPKSSLNLKLNAYDDNKTFNIDLDNNTSLVKNTTSGNIDVVFVDMKDLVEMKNKRIPYHATFGENIDAELPTLGIVYKKQKDDHYLKIDEFKDFEEFVIPIKKANIERSYLEVSSLGLSNIDIDMYAIGKPDSNKSFEVELRSNLDLENNETQGFIRVYDFKYDDKVALRDKDIPFNASFKDDIKAELPSLEVKYKNTDKTHYIDLNNTDKLVSLVKMLESFPIPKSDVHVSTKDFKDINTTLNIDLDTLNTEAVTYGVYYKNQKQKKLSLNTSIKDMKYINVKEPNGAIDANITLDDKPKISVVTNDLGIEYLDKSVSVPKKDDNKTKKTGCSYIALDLPLVNTDMNNGYFKYNTNLINYDSINLDTNSSKVGFKFVDRNSTINGSLDDYKVKLNIKSLDDVFINNVAGLKAIDGGNIDLNVSGTQCNLDGKAFISDLNIKEASALNKIFLVINSAPAAINPFLIIPNAFRFASDGFNLSEYRIDKGRVVFNLDRDKNLLDISKLETIGVHNSFYGKAQLDLANSKIDSNVEVAFMQGMAKVISFIPAVGYWMLGDDERFSYSVDIKGNLSDPEIGINAAKETILAPVNILKRVITYPAKLVDSATSVDDNSSE